MQGTGTIISNLSDLVGYVPITTYPIDDLPTDYRTALPALTILMDIHNH